MCKLVTLNKIIAIEDFSHTKSLRLTTGKLSQAASHPAWGIDPGVNFGLTVIEGENVYIYHGSLTPTDISGQSGWYANNFLDKMIRQYRHKNATLVIEGASYGDRFGQVLLAEVRGGFFLAGVSAPHRFSNVMIKPPKAIRKAVFGDGTIRGPDKWPTLNKNAADSLAMALMAAELECADVH